MASAREILGFAIDELVRHRKPNVPVTPGGDQLVSSSVASPDCETEAIQDGSDAVSDGSRLSRMRNGASGATWVT